MAAAISVAYAVSDEIHQTFIEGRHGSPVDVLIDTAGVAAAVTFIRRRRGVRPPHISLERPPLESREPIVEFALSRVLIAGAAVLGLAILGFPYEGAATVVLAGRRPAVDGRRPRRSRAAHHRRG